jgi:MFS family permease
MAGTPPSETNLAAEASPEAAARDSQPWPSQKLAWYATVLFTLATMMNFFDIAVFGLMIESIKRDLALSDMQIGLLLGPAGVLFYVFVGIPLARLVDIYRRTNILGIGLVITSGMTAVSGMVQSYGQLFFSRMCVGVGGSAHAPGTYSLMADYFPPRKLPRAFGFLQLGFILGSGLAAIVGGRMLGYVAAWEPTPVGPLLIRNWQWVLIATAIPGLLIAFLIFFLREPPRRRTIAAGEPLPMRAVYREIWNRRRVYFPLFIGLALSSIEAQGLIAWRAPFMIRTYGWTPEQIGMWSGPIIIVAMLIGVSFGTWLTERLGKSHRDAPIRTTAIVFALAVPLSVASPLMPTGELAIIMGTLSGVFGIAAAVPQNVAIQTITPNEMRGQVTAIYLFMFIAVGSLGSLLVSTVTVHVVGGEQNLWISMTLVPAVFLPLAVYAIARGMKPYAREMERMEAGPPAP